MRREPVNAASLGTSTASGSSTRDRSEYELDHRQSLSSRRSLLPPTQDRHLSPSPSVRPLPLHL